MSTPLTTGEAAKVLKVSADRVRQLEAEGTLQAVRTASGVRLFERSAVEKLAAERAKNRRRRVA
jgi:excisionase family DNA binding protein